MLVSLQWMGLLVVEQHMVLVLVVLSGVVENLRKEGRLLRGAKLKNVRDARTVRVRVRGAGRVRDVRSGVEWSDPFVIIYYCLLFVGE